MGEWFFDCCYDLTMFKTAQDCTSYVSFGIVVLLKHTGTIIGIINHSH